MTISKLFHIKLEYFLSYVAFLSHSLKYKTKKSVQKCKIKINLSRKRYQKVFTIVLIEFKIFKIEFLSQLVKQ